jgi:hypothetical protein
MEPKAEAGRFHVGRTRIREQSMAHVDVTEELNRLSPFIALAVRKADPEHLDPVVNLITENRSELVERSARRDASVMLAIGILSVALILYCALLIAGAA